MKKPTLSLFLFILSYLTAAQFEQKVSLNIEAGTFITIGSKTYEPEWASSSEDFEPSQMANYKPGIQAGLGLQYNINRRFSLEADAGIMISGKWFYPVYDNVSYLDYFIHDTITDELLAQGSDELDFFNLRIGITPKYYLGPGKNWNPYLFTGLNINYTSVNFRDNQWQAYKDLNMLEPNDTEPSNPYLESNIGIGLNPGVGIEYSFGDKLGLYVSSGYHFILLNKQNFKSIEQEENFHALTFLAGLRFSFIKSKDF